MPTLQEIEARVGVSKGAADRHDISGARAVTAHHRARAIAESRNRNDELLPRAQVSSDHTGSDLARTVPQASDNIQENVRVHITRRHHRGDERRGTSSHRIDIREVLSGNTRADLVSGRPRQVEMLILHHDVRRHDE